MGKLDGQIAVITGGARGIGEGICKIFCKEGATVAMWDILDEGEKTADRIKKEGGNIIFQKVNVTDQSSVNIAVEKLIGEFGKIDILINNAGITKDNLLMRMGEDDFDQVIEVNLKSVFNMTKAVQRTMLKQRKGSIINMSSVVGVKGNAGQTNYAASKAGIIGFSKSVALELGSRDIRSNVIAPGFIETEMTGKLDEQTVQTWRDAIPLKRGGSPKDIANACVFLASDLSSYVTGQVINVDGGMLT